MYERTAPAIGGNWQKGSEGFLAFKVRFLAIQCTDYAICNHFKDEVFPETAIFIPVRCRAVPCAAFGIPVVVAYRFCNGAEYIYTESGIFKQKKIFVVLSSGVSS